MNFSIATLLSNFPDDKSVAPKVLEKKLDCEATPDLQKLHIVLDALERSGILMKDRGRYRRDDREELVEAKLRCSSKGFCFAIQDAEGAEDIYVRESYLSTAWNGDRVLVKVIKEGSRRRSPEGEVRLILERANPSVLARIKEVPGRGYRAVPLDDRLLFEIDLEDDERLKDAVDYLVHVEVQRYPLGAKPPLGRVVQVLGSDAEAANDIDIVCCKHDLPRTFPQKVLDSLETVLQPIDDKAIADRVDLRHLNTLAFANSENEPVDRAYSLTRNKQGNWQLGIHIADVARVVFPDSPLDRESFKRGTSIYLGDMVLPLFPADLCRAVGFAPESDRLAVSVLVTLDENGEIVEYEIQPTTIRLDRLVNNELARQVFDRSEDENDTVPDVPADLLSALEDFATVSQVLREQRYQRGSFDLTLPETHNHFDDETPLGVPVFAPESRGRDILYEFVVLANQLVAEHLNALGVPALYNINPVPDLADVQDAIKLAANMGVELWLEDEEEVYPSDFKQFSEQFAECEDAKILNYLLEAIVRPSYYSTKPGMHFGLALEEGYTHANAPLQRYLDLFVQRVLQAVFEKGRDRRTTRSKERVDLRHSSCHGKINWNVLPPDVQHAFEERLSGLAIALGERERLALEAETDLNGLQKAGAMKERTGEIFRGLITGVQSYGFFVEIESGENGAAPARLEGLVHVSSLKDDWYEYRSRQQTLVGRKNRKQYRLGDRVDVQVKSVDYYRQQIDLAPVGGGSEAPLTDDDYFSEEE
ncbi:iron ABC transporter substrate-binding protein [Leptolyngbya valderiana BDU 20041]|nr:iron ABC transporter substrate-binding protein [Leptolyngbya valderiana BDU 20041]